MSANPGPEESRHDNDRPSVGGGHSCFDKSREIRRRTGIILGLDTHEVISELCREWGTANADEFYKYMAGMSDDELKSYVEAAQKKIRKKKAVQYATQEMEVSAYA